MKIVKEIISLILLIMFAVSTVFNILFLFKVINATLLYIVFFILIFVIFLVSVLGIVLKNIRNEQYVSINITTPAKELGGLYVGMIIIWAVTYFVTIIFK